MAGESQQTPDSVPDPSVFTTEAIVRAARAERDYVNGEIKALVERLGGMDRATELLSDTVGKVPTDLQREISHLKELMDERSNTKNEAIASVREAIRAQGEEHRRANEKVAESMLGQLNALDKSIDDLKERVLRVEEVKRGGIEQRTETRAERAGIYAAIGVAVTLLGAIIVIANLLAR